MRNPNLLSDCLVDDSALLMERSRRRRRVALILGVLVQGLLLTLLLLAPLFGALEPLTFVTVTPIPPYKGSPHPDPQPHAVRGAHQPPKGPLVTQPNVLVEPVRIPEKVADSDSSAPPEIPAGSGSDSPFIGDPNGLISLDRDGSSRSTFVKPPEPPAPKPRPSGPIHVPPSVQEGRLIYRVEPKYPDFARQARLEGKVELRAVITREGTVRSLEVVSGNPAFVRASLDAISQWRYQPTLLHGEPVEVETRITAIFYFR